jgi:hypothetical protein
VTVMAWQKARDAAWREFGRRYWRVIVGLEIARRSAPAVLAGLTVAAAAVGVWWLVAHAPSVSPPDLGRLNVPGRWWWWPSGLLVLAGLVWLALRRNPYRVPGPHRAARRAATVVAALAAVAVFLVWREA